jgi:transcriptional regulator with XRE-family HTH domain
MTPFERIKELARNRNMNVKQLALELGLNETYFYGLNRGKSPTAKNLQKVADFFDVTTDYLLGISDVKPQVNKFDLTDDSYILLFDGKELSDRDKKMVTQLAKTYLENNQDAERTEKDR